MRKIDKLLIKINNRYSIRVLYKRSGQAPEVKIIDNVFKLKETIINNNLKLIPYEYGKILIICNNEKNSQNMQPNIVLTLDRVLGDLLLVKFDRRKREFIGLSQEDIIWYSEDLINKSFNTRNQFSKCYQKNIRLSNEKDLINRIADIEVTLANLLKFGGGKNG